MIVNLEDAGFVVGFTSMYHCYASGFPKAGNISKMVDKRGGVSLGWFIDYILDIAKQRGISKKELTGLFPSKNGNATGWLWNKEHTQSITVEQYNKIKAFLDLPFDTIESAEREIVGKKQSGLGSGKTYAFTDGNKGNEVDITIPSTAEAKALDGSYSGFQPKPALEVVLVVMKPLAEKTYVDQALANGHGVTWLDDCRVPYDNSQEDDSGQNYYRRRDMAMPENKFSVFGNDGGVIKIIPTSQGRFPANILCSDDILNDGVVSKSRESDYNWQPSDNQATSTKILQTTIKSDRHFADTGSFSRYFSLDSWWDDRIKKLPESVQKTFPFIIMPKASKAEKNKGCEGLEEKRSGITNFQPENGILYRMENGEITNTKAKTYQRNHHPTVKPIKLFSYLITLGSREGDLILDPFVGSGTSCVSAKILNRHFIGIERESEYVTIAEKRIMAEKQQMEFSLAGG